MPSCITILGSTGSIGQQTLDVVRQHPDLFRVGYMTANTNVDLLQQQVEEFHPHGVVLCDEGAAEAAQKRFGSLTEVRYGIEACGRAAEAGHIDTVVSAMVGFAGLQPTLRGAAAGKRLAIANKEALVVAGPLLTRQAREAGAVIIPVDSEHSALFQAIAGEEPEGIDRLILTASGGPFRTTPKEEFNAITPERALKHPNWEMGAKITIDSATMMNKGLEVIEASRLFDLPGSRIDVVVHPESIIHSMVQFVDGSVKAQMSMPDMRMPIRIALSWPQRLKAYHEPLSLPTLGSLTFEEPDLDRFPALRLAYEALERDGTAPTVLNAANEVAVASFLQRTLPFSDIPRVIEKALEESDIVDDPSLHDIIECDKRTREAVRLYVVDRLS